MIKVVAKNFIAKDNLAQCIELVQELAQASRQDAGCISYEMYQDTTDETIMTMIETWESEGDLQAHINSPHFKKLVPIINTLATKESIMNVYHKIV